MFLLFVVLLAQTPATMAIVQQLISHKKKVAARNASSIPAAVSPYFLIFAYQWIQGTAVVFKGCIAESSVFHI
jgi:hypothetical protein